jgi:ribosome-binding ATPase
MLIGIIGGPNKGKSTLFSALTLNPVAIADYPFTTINPNFGVAYVEVKCAEADFGVKCKARNSMCINGHRLLPISLVDVAGLVEGASTGKGRGNQFLGDLGPSDVFMLVVDASGKTDINGNQSDDWDPAKDVEIIQKEIILWLSGVISSNLHKICKREDGIKALSEVLSMLRVTEGDIELAASRNSLPVTKVNWKDTDTRRFCKTLLENSKQTLIIANKYDSPKGKENFAKLQAQFGDKVMWTMASIELALRKAAKAGAIDYNPWDKDFKIKEEGLSNEQKVGLAYMHKAISGIGTNVQNTINKVALELLDNIVVYPVEDEGKLSDHSGNILPDAILMKRGSTARDLAFKIHTEIGKSILHAVDARTKMRLSKDYVLKNNDVIKIVSSAR